MYISIKDADNKISSHTQNRLFYDIRQPLLFFFEGKSKKLAYVWGTVVYIGPLGTSVLSCYAIKSINVVEPVGVYLLREYLLRESDYVQSLYVLLTCCSHWTQQHFLLSSINRVRHNNRLLSVADGWRHDTM